ncbi:hypothetical protein [Candidatus Methylomirabilis sp.]|uniref:hypothetical protein n=1 Tax=Candidatus Methylomirabilis sp. TaxID=2032687 RepID=UPI003076346D
MSLPQQLISSLFDLTLTPFYTLSPLWALSLFSLLAGFLMLVIFRFTSNQPRIKETKNGIKAHVLELWLFRDDLRIMLSAQGRILRLNGRYLMLAIKPMLVLIVPMALILLSLEGWFGYRPLHPGEAAIVSMQVTDGETGLLESASIEANNGLTVETPSLKIPGAREVNWRIRADGLGIHNVSMDLLGRRLEKQVIVSQGLVRVSSSRLRSEFWQGLLHPSEPSIPPQSGIERIDIHYPARFIKVFHWNIHWLLYFFVVSTACAFGLKRMLRVEL